MHNVFNDDNDTTTTNTTNHGRIDKRQHQHPHWRPHCCHHPRLVGQAIYQPTQHKSNCVDVSDGRDVIQQRSHSTTHTIRHTSYPTTHYPYPGTVPHWVYNGRIQCGMRRTKRRGREGRGGRGHGRGCSWGGSIANHMLNLMHGGGHGGGCGDVHFAPQVPCTGLLMSHPSNRIVHSSQT